METTQQNCRIKIILTGHSSTLNGLLYLWGSFKNRNTFLHYIVLSSDTFSIKWGTTLCRHLSVQPSLGLIYIYPNMTHFTQLKQVQILPQRKVAWCMQLALRWTSLRPCDNPEGHTAIRTRLADWVPRCLGVGSDAYIGMSIQIRRRSNQPNSRSSAILI